MIGAGLITPRDRQIRGLLVHCHDDSSLWSIIGIQRFGGTGSCRFPCG
ncbi:hypothetical protein GLE_0471 [Lysobacter enzymogenes]|uniref:Uncharacterized protein n=1 Tax=Lysobacter enzymogenes TaxID=69 RepID=A0A0S2DBA8_LYSEN|nr:hypothetical protein GLE_0471 [Lysobacter enzymogenes]